MTTLTEAIQYSNHLEPRGSSESVNVEADPLLTYTGRKSTIELNAMSSKPSYLGLLNAIALGEADGHRLFVAWAEATTNEKLRRVLTVVSIREAEHAAAFTKRISELGFKVRDRRSKPLQNTVDVARSDLSDKKKFKKILGVSRNAPSEDRFSELFKDTSMDPITSALLGRYIAEERDSGRLLRTAHAKLLKKTA